MPETPGPPKEGALEAQLRKAGASGFVTNKSFKKWCVFDVCQKTLW